MKKENYKVGETVFFMESNKPKSGKITAVLIVEGKVKLDYTTHDVKEGEKLTLYYAGFSTFKEEEVFATLEALKESVFNSVNDEK